MYEEKDAGGNGQGMELNLKSSDSSVLGHEPGENLREVPADQPLRPIDSYQYEQYEKLQELMDRSYYDPTGTDPGFD